jgi:hypothetical protein
MKENETTTKLKHENAIFLVENLNIKNKAIIEEMQKTINDLMKNKKITCSHHIKVKLILNDKYRFLNLRMNIWKSTIT